MFFADMEVAIGMTVSLHITHAHVASKVQGGEEGRTPLTPPSRSAIVCFFDLLDKCDTIITLWSSRQNCVTVNSL